MELLRVFPFPAFSFYLIVNFKIIWYLIVWFQDWIGNQYTVNEEAFNEENMIMLYWLFYDYTTK